MTFLSARFLALNITPVSLIVFIICLLSGITLFLTYKTKNNTAFGKLLLWAVFFIFLHSLYIFTVEVWFINDHWKDRLAPFSLLYGPFLYFSTIAVKRDHLPRWMVLMHAVPFIFYGTYFILLLTEVIPSTDKNQDFLRSHLMILNPLSFGIYTICSIIAGRNVFFSKFKGKVLLFVFSRILLLFATMLSIAILFSKNLKGNEQAILLIRMTMYICMLLCVLAILNYTVNKLLIQAKAEPVTSDEEKQLPKYERSALSGEQLNEYEQLMKQIIMEEQLFLDKNLSLTGLSQHLRIPNHHLTQVFNMKIKQTFYQYINALRIEHACKLILRYPTGITMERLAEDSGFNSKVSFNRHFKEMKKCTPSAYKAQQ